MQISFSLPENQFITESPEEVTRKIRMYAAIGLYQSGEISIGAARELAGMDHYTFLEFCKQEGVTLQTQTPEELEAEFKKFNTDCTRVGTRLEIEFFCQQVTATVTSSPLCDPKGERIRA